MCGITGFVNLGSEIADTTIVKRMTDAIAHRGPDGEGQWVDGAVALGHRRLSIIDLSEAASQPMRCRDNRYVLSYNGEVYNYKELRKELQAQGQTFVSQSDTEVVLIALKTWGEKALAKFNGMFALAFYDRQRQRLLLARDRYGIKPLYYGTQGQLFSFGSEQKAMLAHPDNTAALNKAALLEYFTFQNILTQQTLNQGIFSLPAGHYGVLSLATQKPQLTLTQYWDFDFVQSQLALSCHEYEEELDFLFRQAVKRQLVSDVELGCYLSGGVDSGSITSVTAQTHPFVKTFTCGFDMHSVSGLEIAFDEREKAEHMSYMFKTEHYEMILKAGDMERCLPTLTHHLEEPRVGQSYPNFYAAKLASRFVSVVLSGIGGDELFGGYPWRYYRAMVNQNFDDYIDKYYLFWQRLLPNSELRKVFAPVWEEVRHVWTRDIFASVFQHHADTLLTPEDYINHSMYFEAKTFLPGLLMVEDKLSMAHGLESRVPFLDNDLVDFAMRCPVSLKLKNLQQQIRLNENEQGKKTQTYYKKTGDGKNILRNVMQRYVSSEIATADKQGFSAPDATWFKGDSIDFVKRRLLNDNNPMYQIFDQKALSALINEHLSGAKNRRLLIWSLLNISELYEQNYAPV